MPRVSRPGEEQRAEGRGEGHHAALRQHQRPEHLLQRQVGLGRRRGEPLRPGAAPSPGTTRRGAGAGGLWVVTSSVREEGRCQAVPPQG